MNSQSHRTQFRIFDASVGVQENYFVHLNRECGELYDFFYKAYRLCSREAIESQRLGLCNDFKFSVRLPIK